MNTAAELPNDFNFTMPTPKIHACPEHGEYRGQASDAPCPECRDALDQTAAQIARDWLTFHRWRAAGLPSRLEHKTRASWRPSNAADRQTLGAVNSYVAQIHENAGAGRGLVLLGGPGLGKSHLLAALVCDAVEAGAERARYFSWPALIQAHRQNQHESGSPLHAAIDADFLAIDELGALPATEWEAGQLFRVIDARYAEQRPTVIASNLTAHQLPAAIGERAADRLRESCLWLSMSGESKRGKATLPPDPVRFAEPPQEAVSRVWKGDAG
jgi:DNA replication protein DnaC